MDDYIKRDKAMSRYIDQDKVIDAVLNLDTTNRISWRDAVIDMIDAMAPEDVKPVVRCKDCYHYPNPYADCPMVGWARNEDDYCSKAERKGADNEVN